MYLESVQTTMRLLYVVVYTLMSFNLALWYWNQGFSTGYESAISDVVLQKIDVVKYFNKSK